jgi:hypothetical protein
LRVQRQYEDEFPHYIVPHGSLRLQLQIFNTRQIQKTSARRKNLRKGTKLAKIRAKGAK